MYIFYKQVKWHDASFRLSIALVHLVNQICFETWMCFRVNLVLKAHNSHSLSQARKRCSLCGCYYLQSVHFINKTIGRLLRLRRLRLWVTFPCDQTTTRIIKTVSKVVYMQHQEVYRLSFIPMPTFERFFLFSWKMLSE